MECPRPNEPVSWERCSPSSLSPCMKTFRRCLFWPKQAKNHDEWSVDKEFHSCFIEPLVSWRWGDVTREIGETLDWAWPSRFGWVGETKRFTRIRLPTVGEPFGRSSNVKWKNREWIIERRALHSYRNSRQIDRCRVHHRSRRWCVAVVSYWLRKRHEMESSACARSALFCSSISFV